MATVNPTGPAPVIAVTPQQAAALSHAALAVVDREALAADTVFGDLAAAWRALGRWQRTLVLLEELDAGVIVVDPATLQHLADLETAMRETRLDVVRHGDLWHEGALAEVDAGLEAIAACREAFVGGAIAG